jgi:hypothetical protein
VRDLLTRNWTLEDPMQWADDHPELIAQVVATYLGTVGGTLQLTGTPERGRVTVTDTEGVLVTDVGWMTLTDEELAEARRGGRG